MHYLLSFGAIIVGIVMVIYNFQIVRIFGHQDWAERYLGSGGTYAAWKIVGVIFIIGGIYSLRG